MPLYMPSLTIINIIYIGPVHSEVKKTLTNSPFWSKGRFIKKTYLGWCPNRGGGLTESQPP